MVRSTEHATGFTTSSYRADGSNSAPSEAGRADEDHRPGPPATESMMSQLTSDPPADEAASPRLLRLLLDLDDLRAENARLKGSIAQRQDEILRLGERLAGLQKRFALVQRAAAWMQFRRLRTILRRLR